MSWNSLKMAAKTLRILRPLNPKPETLNPANPEKLTLRRARRGNAGASYEETKNGIYRG